MKGGAFYMGTQITKNKGGYLYLDSPREQLMKMLVEKTLATGHRLSFKEVSKDSEMRHTTAHSIRRLNWPGRKQLIQNGKTVHLHQV